MYNLLKRLVGISIFYSIANSIEALSPFLLAIILTRLMAPEDYGLWVLFVSLVAFLRPVVNLTIQDALKMRFYEMDQAERSAFVVSALYLSVASTLLLVVIALVFSNMLSALLAFPAAWMTAIVIVAFLYVNFYFILAYYQFSEKRGQFVTLQLVQSIVGFTAITVLVYEGWSWQGVVLGKIAGLALTCLIGFGWMARELRLDLAARSRSQIKELIKFGLCYLPTGFGLVAVPLTDRLIIAHVLGLNENGLYGVAALFGSALFVAINGFLHAWMPWLFQQLAGRHDQYRKEISVVSLGFMLLLPMMGLVFYLVSVVAAPHLIGAAFTSSFALIPWAIAGTVAMGYFYHNQAFLHFKQAVLPMSFSSVNSIVLNIVLSYYGAVYYGVAGVLAATIGAYMLSALISGIFMVQHYDLFGLPRRLQA